MTCLFCGKPLTDRQEKRKTRFCSKSCSNSYRYRNVKREYVCQGCGKTYTKKNTGTKNGTKYCSHECGRKSNLGKKFTEEHKRKIAEGQFGVREEGNFWCDKCGDDFGSNTSLRAHKAHCGHSATKLRCYNCGRQVKGLAGLQRHQMWCINTPDNQKSRKNLLEGVRAGNIRRLTSGIGQGRGTKPEVRMGKWLDKNGIPFTEQFHNPAVGNHCYDFLVGENLIVEVDGDYWHGNPKRFTLTGSQKRQFHIDKKYTLSARVAGYNVIRYWESDIMARMGKVMTDLNNVLDGKESKLARDM